MSLTAETAPAAIEAIKNVFHCTDLEAITKLQGEAAKAGDEPSLEVLCASKWKLIEEITGCSWSKAAEHHADCLCNECIAGIGDSPN